MKNSLYPLLFTIILISSIAVSCKQKTGTGSENKIQFDSVYVDKKYHLLDNPEYPNCDLQINFMYPVKCENKTVLADVQKQFVSSFFGDIYEELSPKEAIDKYVNLYLEDYKSLETYFKEELTGESDMPIASLFSHYENSSNEITYNKNNILCYSVSVESYTGGAHGAHSTMNYALDLTTGTVITEEDIFIKDFQDALAQILVDKITEQNEITNPKELETIGYFSVDEIFPNGNFSLNDKSITYYFNEYEIAAYVVGLITVEIPYGEIKHLLKKESPIANLI